MRPAFFMAYDEANCEFVKLASKEIDERLKNGPEMVSANFVIPYPPGFPIMVPGQVIDADTIAFMRKLDVKEIHGYNAAQGLKLIKLSVLGPARKAGADRLSRPTAPDSGGSASHNIRTIAKGGTAMIDWIIETLKANTHLVIFLTLAIGYWAGNFKIGKFALGSVTGTLLAGVLIGQLGFDISPQVKTMFFTMFLFAVGYSVGPQFVQGVARDGLPQAIFGVVVSLLCLASVYVAAKIAGYDVGLAAGLLAGSQTISASIGLATDAINNSGVENPEALLNQIPVAYAITYMFGHRRHRHHPVGARSRSCSMSTSQRSARKYEAEMAKGTPAGGMGTRMAAIADARLPGQGKWPGGRQDRRANSRRMVKESRMFVERLRRDGQIIDFDANTVLKAGDIGVISGKTEALVALSADGRGSGGHGTARHSGRIGRPRDHQQGSQWQDPDRHRAARISRAACSCARSPAARPAPTFRSWRRPRSTAATSSRFPAARPMSQRVEKALGYADRAIRGDRHDLGRHLHRRIRPDRRHHGQGRRCADHAVGLRRRVVRWPDPRLGCAACVRPSAACRSRPSGS